MSDHANPGPRLGRLDVSAAHPRPQRIGLYPGTFDPVTNGHLDVIARAARLLDKLIVGVSISAGKGPMFSLEERVELVEAEISAIADRNGMVIEVRPFDTLLIDFARKVGASMIVRGLRAVTDFDFEFQMFGMNYRMAPDIETVTSWPANGTSSSPPGWSRRSRCWMATSPLSCRRSHCERGDEETHPAEEIEPRNRS